jgi:hypothetical protein
VCLFFLTQFTIMIFLDDLVPELFWGVAKSSILFFCKAISLITSFSISVNLPHPSDSIEFQITVVRQAFNGDPRARDWWPDIENVLTL